MKHTGTGIEGPGSDLWFMLDDDGDERVAIAYHDAYRDDPVLSEGLDEFRPFLAATGIDGVLDLESVLEPGVFAYDLRGGLSIAEVLAAFRQLGRPCGVRAAAELLQQAAEVLADAADVGVEHGLPNHGDISPWRLVLDGEGYVDVLGHGLLNLAVAEFLAERADSVPADGLRYAPPERLELAAEDVQSDLFSLALIAAEMVSGQPVLDGSAEDIVERLLGGDLPARIEALCPDAGDAMLDLLCIATEPDPDNRYRDADEFIAAAKAAVAAGEGDSLLDVLDAARAVEVRTAMGPAPAVDEGEAAPERSDSTPTPDEPVDAAQPQSAAPDDPVEPASSPTPAAPPEPVAAEPDPNDPFAPPAPLAKLPAGATLEAVRQRATDVVERVGRIAALIRTMAQTAAEEAEGGSHETVATARRLQDAVSKVERSETSAKRSAGLVELDEEADEAIVTLGLVTGAEQQADNALESAREWLDEIRAAVAEAQAEQGRIDAFADEVNALVDTCSGEVGQASEALQGLLDQVANEVLSAPGVDEAVSRAKGAMDRARAASNKAIESIDEIAECATAEDAEAFADTARTARSTVAEALADVLNAVESASDAESAGLESARADVQEEAERATAAHDQAAAALSRARSAVEMGPSPEASALLEQAEAQLKVAKQAAHDAGVEARTVAGAERSADAREALEPARTAAATATDAAATIDDLCKRASELAGAAAEAAAALIAARKTTDSILHKAREQVTAARGVVDALLADTDEVKGSAARALVDDAKAQIAQAESALEDLEGHHAMAEKLDDPSEVEAVVATMRPLGTTTTKATGAATTAAEECRHIAQHELAEIMAERARLAALDSAATQAKDNADRCRRAVDEAWVRYRGLPELVTGTDIEAARKLLKQAYDLIDIAEFQAGEASAAAKDAARQGDPAEAAGYAESAASFWERISEDLPEALRCIDQAEEMATREAQLLAEARQTTTDAAAEVVEARTVIDAAIDNGAELATPWPDDKAVQGALTRIRKAQDGLDEDLAEVEYSRERAAGVETAEAAQEMVPVADKVLRRVRDKRSGAEAALADLKKAVQIAEQQQARLTELNAEVEQLAEAVLEQAKAARASLQQLEDAALAAAAIGPEIQDIQAQAKAEAEACSTTRQQVRELQDALRTAQTTDAAEALAVQAREGLTSVTASAARVAELATQGATAAQAEADARTQAEEQRKAEARTTAQESASKARNAVAAVTHSRDETQEIVVGAPSREAQDRLAEAERLLVKLTGLAEASEAAAATALAETGADDVLAAGMDAREACQRATAASRQALAALDQARSLALSAMEQATALAAVRHQMEELAARADAAVTLAREQSSFLDEVLDDATTDRTRALRGDADEAIANARKAATKVHTALPMVAEAESLDVAKHMLKAAEKAVNLATEAAARVPALVEQAKQRLIEDAEAARMALANARTDAAAPLEQARAAVDKANGWVEAGQPAVADHADTPAVAEAFGELHATLATLQAGLAAAERAAEPAPAAQTVEAANAIGAEVQKAADAVLIGITEVSTARKRFTDAVEAAVEGKRAMTEAKARIAEAVTSRAEQLETHRATFAAFETEVRAANLDDAETADLLDRVEEFLRVATDAVHRARKAEELVTAAADAAAVTEAAAVADDRIDRADETLDALVKGVADGEDELTRMVAEAAEKKRQAEEAARLKELELQRERERKEREARRAARPARGLRPAGPPRTTPRPGGPRATRPARGGDAGEDRAARRLRRPSTVRDGDADGPTKNAPSRAERRLRRPSRSPEDVADTPRTSAADRRLRRPSRSPDDSPRPTRAERRLRRPSRSPDGPPTGGEEPADESGSNKNDVRSRLRERRASRMATGSQSVSERPVRPTTKGPRRAGGRLPSRPGGDSEDSESGADLLKRRISERSNSPRKPRESSERARPERSVDDLMERIKRRHKKSQGDD